MKKLQKSVPINTAPRVDGTADMQAYYTKTGLYRPDDLQRVLGDPRKGFSVEVKTEFPLAARVK